MDGANSLINEQKMFFFFLKCPKFEIFLNKVVRFMKPLKLELAWTKYQIGWISEIRYPALDIL